jgi:hypothetical protein
MRTIMCPREPEILDAVLAGTWPAGAAGALIAHARACAVCSDLAAVAGSIREDADQLIRQASIPSAGTMWWRLSVRARLASAETADRPIAVLHWLASASLSGTALAVAILLATWTQRTRRWAGSLDAVLPHSALDSLKRSALFVQDSLPLALAALTLGLTPLILYLVFPDD